MQVLPLTMKIQLDIKATNMRWGYRLLKTKDGDDDFYQIHEVYYNEKGKVDGWTVKGATVGGSDIAEVKWVLIEMLSCLERDVIKDK